MQGAIRCTNVVFLTLTIILLGKHIIVPVVQISELRVRQVKC